MIGGRAAKVAWEVVNRTFADGFIHAGNLAYLSLTTLFPVFVIIAAIAGAAGRTQDGLEALRVFMATVPPDVANLLAKPITDLISQQTGNLLTFGIVVGLWSTTSFIETIRDIIRRAFGVTGGSIWRFRLGGIAGVVGAVLLLIIAFALQFVLAAVQGFIARLLPVFDEIGLWVAWSRLAPALIMFGALNAAFKLLTPARYRRQARGWPGALLTTAVWIGATTLLPPLLATLANYQATYGSLAGVMISLLFFYVVGIGLVTGAHLNAVLAGVEPAAAKEQRGQATA